MAAGPVQPSAATGSGPLNALKSHREALAAFSAAQRAYITSDEPGESSMSPRRAASRLSSLLEDSDPQVAAAANLWQACLRSLEADPSRALAVLDLVLDDPSPKQLPYAFFARLLRCRLIAARGGFTASLALLLQMEPRLDKWIPSDADRATALRATALVEIQILRQWYDHLDASTQIAERRWCAERIDALRTERFGGSNATVFRLKNAVPLMQMTPGPNPEPLKPTPNED